MKIIIKSLIIIVVVNKYRTTPSQSNFFHWKKIQTFKFGKTLKRIFNKNPYLQARKACSNIIPDDSTLTPLPF